MYLTKVPSGIFTFILNPLNLFSMSVVTIYPNEALQYHDALNRAIHELDKVLSNLSDKPEDVWYMNDNAIRKMDVLDISIQLLEKLKKQIEQNVSIPANQLNPLNTKQ